jgi:surfeit locus 1 family protein
MLGARLEQAMSAPALDLPSSALKPDDVAWKRVAARGEFIAERTIFLDNRIHRGRAGYEVITPLRLSGSTMHVLINRGWAPLGAKRDALPKIATPTSAVRVEGIALARLPHAMEAGTPATGAVRQNLEVAAFAAETGLALQPFVVQQHAGAADGLARDWPRPDSGMQKHEAYALQWYSLGALAVLLFIGLSFSRVAAR